MTSPPAGRSARPVCSGAGNGLLRCRAPMLFPGTERRRLGRARRIQLRHLLADRRFAHSPPAPRSRAGAPQPPVPEQVLDHAARLAEDARRELHATVAAAASSLAGGFCFAAFGCRLRLRRAASECRTRLPVVIAGFPCVSCQSSVTSSQWRILCVFDFPFLRFPSPSPFCFFLLSFIFSAPPCWSVAGFSGAR